MSVPTPRDVAASMVCPVTVGEPAIQSRMVAVVEPVEVSDVSAPADVWLVRELDAVFAPLLLNVVIPVLRFLVENWHKDVRDIWKSRR